MRLNQERIIKEVANNKDLKLVFQYLSKTRKREPKTTPEGSGILDLIHLLNNMRGEGIKITRAAIRGVAQSLESLGLGVYDTEDADNLRFLWDYPMLRVVRMALKDKPDPKIMPQTTSEEDKVSPTSPVFKLTGEIVKALPLLTKGEVESLINLLKLKNVQ